MLTYVVHQRRDCCAINRTIRLVGLQGLQRNGVIKLQKEEEWCLLAVFSTCVRNMPGVRDGTVACLMYIYITTF
jgi:hypothetical protein